jgi:hypothetical protein
MNITLPDGRKATVVNQINDKMVTIRFEDGRETMWPVDKLPKEKEGEDTLKMVKVSALEKYAEFKRDLKAVRMSKNTQPDDLFNDDATLKFINLDDKLHNDALDEFKQKWGLT